MNEPKILAIIPFYFGKNKFVNKKGGAPVAKKSLYLKMTIDSLKQNFKNIDIIIFTSNPISTTIAKNLHHRIIELKIPSIELPIQSVLNSVNLSQNKYDFVFFTEDDQVLFIEETIKKDIFSTHDEVCFSPHRWAKLFLGFLGRKKYFPYTLNKKRGFIDNFDINYNTMKYRYNHTYEQQMSKIQAYSACWIIQSHLLKRIISNAKINTPVLESASYIIFDSNIPILKLSIANNENPKNFLVNHLSGYDYHKRKILPFLK